MVARLLGVQLLSVFTSTRATRSGERLTCCSSGEPLPPRRRRRSSGAADRWVRFEVGNASVVGEALSSTIRIVAGLVLIATKIRQPVASRVFGLVLLLVTSGCTYITISSVSSTSEQGNGPSLGPAVSANGRFVAVDSNAT